MNNGMMKEITLDNINGGVALELFKRELDIIAKNINDINTSPKDKRKLTLTFTFSPDDDRREVAVTVVAKSNIAPVKPQKNTIYCAKVDGRPTLVGNDTDQMELDFHSDGVTTIQEQTHAN